MLQFLIVVTAWVLGLMYLPGIFLPITKVFVSVCIVVWVLIMAVSYNGGIF